ncbi:MAG: ATP-binding protein, partial [Planctomycetota bacterium]
MKNPKQKPDWLDELRLRAEELLGKGKDKDMTNADAFAWVHELQVHQTELEMQNEELKRSRQELEESRNKYLELYEFSPIGYFTLDKQSTILEVNLSGAALLGIERGSLSGRRFQLFVETDLRPEFNTFCNRVFESDFKQTCELRLVKNDASLWYAYLEGIAMRNGDVKQCQIAVVDITKQKHAQDEEARLKDQLFHAQNLASVGILAGGVAHNFNNLLMVVMGYATILQMELEKGGSLGEYAQKIIHATQMAGNLSKDLLAFSRKKPVHLQAVNMNTIIKNTEDMLPKLMRENSNCKMTFTEKDCFVMADSDQIMHVLMNLATNARDAMPNGGELEICTDVVEMDDTFVKAHGFDKIGKYVLTSFSDTGMGMDEDTRLRIFEPFFTTKEVGKGTGLGLATVYGIIKQHNGHIDVESKKGIGTT